MLRDETKKLPSGIHSDTAAFRDGVSATPLLGINASFGFFGLVFAVTRFPSFILMHCIKINYLIAKAESFILHSNKADSSTTRRSSVVMSGLPDLKFPRPVSSSSFWAHAVSTTLPHKRSASCAFFCPFTLPMQASSLAVLPFPPILRN